MGERVSRAFAAVWPALGLILALALLTAWVATGVTDVQTAGQRALIMVLVVVGLYVFVGNSGVLSVGHAGFMAIGAYVAGILCVPVIQRAILLPGLPGWASDFAPGTFAALLIGAAVAMVIAAIVAVPLMRLDGLAASVATLAGLIIVQTVLLNWKMLSGTSGATPGVPVDIGLWGAFWWAAVAIAIAWAFQRSALGLRLRASRDEGIAARSIGVSIVAHRCVAFVLSAGIVAIGGGLYAHFVGVLSPGDFYFGITFLMIAMLVVGGINSLSGAVVGTVVLALATEILDRFEEGKSVGGFALDIPVGTTQMIVAVALVIVLAVRPNGITGGREWRRVVPARLAERLRARRETEAG